MKPLISIITASYNSSKTIEKTILSILNQTYSNIEYIIIDGSSTDNTVEIIKSFESKFIDKCIKYKWISEKDKGIYDAFNKGLSMVEGDYIGFLNSDDWFEPLGLEYLSNSFKETPAIYCGHMNLYSNCDNKFVKLHKSNPNRIYQTMRIAHPATLVSYYIFKQIGLFSLEYKIAGDYDFFLQAKIKGFEIIVVDQIISNMLLGGISNNIPLVLKEERVIKNKHLGNKCKHWLWYFLNVFVYKSTSVLRKYFNYK